MVGKSRCSNSEIDVFHKINKTLIYLIFQSIIPKIFMILLQVHLMFRADSLNWLLRNMPMLLKKIKINADIQ